jgi:hypothetical protein
MSVPEMDGDEASEMLKEKIAAEHHHYRLSDADRRKIEVAFTYHPPLPDQPERYEYLRDQGKSLALTLAALCPSSRELSLALTHLEEAVMWANAAIARNERASSPEREKNGD